VGDHVYLATPYTRAFDDEHVASLLSLHLPTGSMRRTVGWREIDVARNILLQDFLEEPTKPRWLLMVDSDATFHADSVERLISRDLPVVSAMMYRRKLPPVPTLGVLCGATAEGQPVYRFDDTIHAILKHAEAHHLKKDTPNELVLPKRDDDILPIDGSGLHFTLIRRDVAEAIKKPAFKFKAPGGGEDFFFFERVRAAGFEAFGDLSVHTGHLIGPGEETGIREMLAFLKLTNEIVPEQEVWQVGEWDWDT